MVYVGIYALIYPHTILGERIVSRNELPRGVLPSLHLIFASMPTEEISEESFIVILNLNSFWQFDDFHFKIFSLLLLFIKTYLKVLLPLVKG